VSLSRGKINTGVRFAEPASPAVLKAGGAIMKSKAHPITVWFLAKGLSEAELHGLLAEEGTNTFGHPHSSVYT
jgi:hypothetical protein